MSFPNLADSLGIDRSTAQRLVRRLQAKGLVALESPGGHGPRSTNVYIVLPTPLEAETERPQSNDAPAVSDLVPCNMHQKAGQLATLKGGSLHGQGRQSATQGEEGVETKTGGGSMSPPPRSARPSSAVAETATAAPRREALLPLLPDPAPAAEEAGLDRVMGILAPAGAAPRLRVAIINGLADAAASGVPPQEIAGALPRAGPGRPWERIAAAVGIVMRERQESARLQAEAQERRRATEVSEGAAAAEGQAIEPPADPVVRAVFDLIDRRAWGVWFRGVSFARTAHGLTVRTPNAFIRDYLSSHFSEALGAVADGVPLRFDVAQAQPAAGTAAGRVPP